MQLVTVTQECWVYYVSVCLTLYKKGRPTHTEKTERAPTSSLTNYRQARSKYFRVHDINELINHNELLIAIATGGPVLFFCSYLLIGFFYTLAQKILLPGGQLNLLPVLNTQQHSESVASLSISFNIILLMTKKLPGVFPRSSSEEFATSALWAWVSASYSGCNTFSLLTGNKL